MTRSDWQALQVASKQSTVARGKMDFGDLTPLRMCYVKIRNRLDPVRRNCMITKKPFGLTVMILCFSLYIVPSQMLFGQEKEITPGELIARHLRSIGTPEKLAEIKSRGLSGRAAVQFIQGGTGQVTDGQFLCVSEGRKIGMVMKFGDLQYPGEYFAFNGIETTVGHINPGQRSPIADFIFRYNALMREGLLGGVFSVAWPLLDIRERQVELQYRKATISDRSFHALDYISKNLGDIKVTLFFDMNTFRHLRTEYRVRLANDMTAMNSVNPGTGPNSIDQRAVEGIGRPMDRSPGATIMESQPDSIYLMIEQFGNFADVGGLALPQDYTIDYSIEGYGASFLAKWAVLVEHWKNNGNIDQTFFVAQQ